MTLAAYNTLSVFCFLLSLGLGMLFSVMESAILMLNRARLIQLFGDAQPDGVSEQHIFRETKEVYLIARLGLCSALVLCGFSLAWILIKSFKACASEPSALWPAAAGIGTAFLLTPPLYLFAAYAVPRLLVRQAPVDNESELPRWIRALLKLGRFCGFFLRVFSFIPTEGFALHHQLSKNDLVKLVTGLETTEEESPAASQQTSPANAPSAETAGEPESADEEEFIYNMLDMEQTMVREVMKPINKVVAASLATTTIGDLLYLARSTGYSRFPVYRDRIVDLIGCIHIDDILREESPGKDIEAYVRPVFVVPEYMRVNNLFKEFLERHTEVAVVVDEYGGCSGWVTRENVLEEIVGEIADEFDHRRRQIRKIDGSRETWLVDGAIHIDDLAEEVPIRFDEEAEYDTLAGFVLMTLGRMPAPGDKIQTEQAVFEVERLEGNRVADIRIRLLLPEEKEVE